MKTTKMTAFVLLLVMISLVLISGTLAKYATEFTGTDTVTVAKWKVSVKDLAGNAYPTDEETTTFNLFEESKIYDLAGLAAEEEDVKDVDLSGVTAVADSDVKTGKIIAPGTWGKVGFQVIVDKTTEVSVNYGIKISDVTNTAKIPLEFSLNGSDWTSNPKELDCSGTVLASELGSADVTRTATLYWRWLYERTESNADKNDTTLGVNANTYKITATFGATQAD